MRTAHAQELLLACPTADSDIYRVHQTVWPITNRHQDVRHTPTLLYRAEDGIIRVRISDCAMRGTRPVKVTLTEGTEMTMRVKLALWRTVPTRLQPGQLQQRIRELLGSAGLTCLDIQCTRYVAQGHKQRLGVDIALPIADVSGRVRVDNSSLACNAWRQGVGRGKRFGFGMLDLINVPTK